MAGLKNPLYAQKTKSIELLRTFQKKGLLGLETQEKVRLKEFLLIPLFHKKRMK